MATVKTLIGNVKGNPGKDGSENQIYSKDETVIGKWIDGKPIYRKIVEYSDFGTYSISDLNADNFINIIAMFYRQESGRNFAVGPYFKSASDYWNHYVVDNNLIIRGSINGSATKKKFSFIYEYTKTTDTATI